MHAMRLLLMDLSSFGKSIQTMEVVSSSIVITCTNSLASHRRAVWNQTKAPCLICRMPNCSRPFRRIRGGAWDAPACKVIH
jgi:hypothetical protein